MINYDLHMHTTYCDGKNSPEEMVLSAIAKGLKVVGISGHSTTPFDSRYCMSEEKTKKYIEEIKELKIKYKDQITVLCGIEQDFYAGVPKYDFDYVIGSVHYVFKDGNYLPVDESSDVFQKNVSKYYNGDYIAFAEDYFKNVSEVITKTNADIIGHFDLVTKFNEGYKMFDETDLRYVKAWREAVDKLIPFNKPFEVNSGAISRGYRTEPYPSLPILEYIKRKGGRVILSSDSHSAENIAFRFNEIEQRLVDLMK